MGLLYKRVQHHNLFPNLSAIEGTSDPFFRSGSQLKKAVTHRLRQLVWKVTPHDFHSLKQRKSSSSNPIWESFYQQPYIFVKKLNDVVCRRNRLNRTDCRCGSWLFSRCRFLGTHETPVETNRKNYSKKEITPIDRLGAPVAARAYELGTADVELGYRLGSGPWEEAVEARE